MVLLTNLINKREWKTSLLLNTNADGHPQRNSLPGCYQVPHNHLLLHCMPGLAGSEPKMLFDFQV